MSNPLQPTKVWVNRSDGGIEPKELYCFTKEELEKEFLFLMSEGWKRFDASFKTPADQTLSQFKEYIKQLLP